MEEDDLDFTPTHNTSSNLASLFVLNKKSLEGNTSLTYTAPKAPKRESSPLKIQNHEEKNNKGIIIYSHAVQAYKLEHRKYVDQGLAGVVITGNHVSSLYAIILYNHAKEHIANMTITKTFNIILSANNYVSFYDNKKQNWSIMFQSPSEVQHFVEKVSICKFYCYPGSSENILIQDLSPASNVNSYSNSTVEITYSSFTLTPQTTSLIKESVHDKVEMSDSNSMLAKSLTGCTENTTRIIIVPHSLSASWKNKITEAKDLLLKIKIVKIISQIESSIMDAKLTGDNVDSSTEDVKKKTKTASIKEVIASTKSQKANLISRMARMGQATLPLKQGLASGQSDSEEDCASSSSLKPRLSRAKASGVNVNQSTGLYLPQNSTYDGGSQLPVCQNDVSWNQMQLGKYAAPHHVISVSGSPMVFPASESNLSLFVSESRMQAAELRMNISKVLDKVDAVFNKVQTLTPNNIQSNSYTATDSNGILSGVQSLVAENERLKVNLEEQKKKLELQNDRIFHLLEQNQRYSEQSSTSAGKHSETELKLKKELESYAERDSQSREDCKKLKEKINSLEEELKLSENEAKKFRQINEKFSAELESCKKITEENSSMKSTVESYEDKLGKASEVVSKLKDKLKEIMVENERLKTVIHSLRENMETHKSQMEGALKTKSEEHEKALRTLQTKLLDNESKHESALQEVNSMVNNLKEENKQLLLDYENEKERWKNEERKSLDQIYLDIKRNLTDESQYSCSQILSLIEKSFKVSGKISAEVVTISTEPEFVPVTETSKQNVDVVAENETKEQSYLKTTQATSIEEVAVKGVMEKESVKSKKEEICNMNNSYDQRWRTTKPPPLFDDEDDDDWLH